MKWRSTTSRQKASPMNITDEEIAMLEAATSEREWNKACDVIKKARNNSYPPDWWVKVKMSGMMDRILAKFGMDSEIKIETV